MHMIEQSRRGGLGKRTGQRYLPAPARPVAQPSAGHDPYRIVFDVIRLGTAQTRREIAEQTGLSPSVVARCVRRMLGKGLIEDVERSQSTGGRAPRILKIRGRNGWVLAIDLGISHITAAIATLNGTIVASRSQGIETNFSPEDVLDMIDVALGDLIVEAGVQDSDLIGVGMGLPGAVSDDGHKVVATSLSPLWVGYPLGTEIRKRYDVSAFIENDAKVMALGELRVGGLRHGRVGLLLKVGTGIGAGITVNGSLHRGVDGWAGDIGHVWLGAETPTRCGCGHIGCLEGIAGGAAIVSQATETAIQGGSPMLLARLKAAGELTVDDLRSCAHHGDPASLQIMQRASDMIGVVLAMAVNMLNPDVVTISGGVARSGEAFLSGIRKQVYGHAHPAATRRLRIEPSQLGEKGGVVGATWLVLDGVAAGAGFQFAGRP